MPSKKDANESMPLYDNPSLSFNLSAAEAAKLLGISERMLWTMTKAGEVPHIRLGRRMDLHALRATLGTRLARQGVAPAITQKIMRLADDRTTQQHYQDISLADTASALANLSGGEEEDQPECASDDPPVRQQYQQPGERDEVRGNANQGDREADGQAANQEHRSSQRRGLCGEEPPCAMISTSNAGVTQLVECQPSKLNVEGSSPFARFERTLVAERHVAYLITSGGAAAVSSPKRLVLELYGTSQMR